MGRDPVLLMKDEIRLGFSLESMNVPLAPIKVVRRRYTAFYCGFCSGVVAFGSKRCRECGQLLDWEALYPRRGDNDD